MRQTAFKVGDAVRIRQDVTTFREGTTHEMVTWRDDRTVLTVEVYDDNDGTYLAAPQEEFAWYFHPEELEPAFPAPDLLPVLTRLLDAFERHRAGFPLTYEQEAAAVEQANNAIAAARGEN